MSLRPLEPGVGCRRKKGARACVAAPLGFFYGSLLLASPRRPQVGEEVAWLKRNLPGSGDGTSASPDQVSVLVNGFSSFVVCCRWLLSWVRVSVLGWSRWQELLLPLVRHVIRSRCCGFLWLRLWCSRSVAKNICSEGKCFVSMCWVKTLAVYQYQSSSLFATASNPPAQRRDVSYG